MVSFGRPDPSYMPPSRVFPLEGPVPLSAHSSAADIPAAGAFQRTLVAADDVATTILGVPLAGNLTEEQLEAQDDQDIEAAAFQPGPLAASPSSFEEAVKSESLPPDKTFSYTFNDKDALAYEKATLNPTVKRNLDGLQSKRSQLEKDITALELIAKNPHEISTETMQNLRKRQTTACKNEYEQLLTNPDTLKNAEAISRVEALEAEIRELTTGSVTIAKLIGQELVRLKEALDATIADYDNFKAEAESTGATFGSTNTPRFAFQFLTDRTLATLTGPELEKLAEKNALDLTRMDSGNSDLSDKEIEQTDAYRENKSTSIIAFAKARDAAIPKYMEELRARKNNGIGVLINSEIHQVSDAKGTVLSSIGRSGAPSDFAHGEISLAEMRDYQKLLALRNGTLTDAAEIKKLVIFYGLAEGFFDRVKNLFSESQEGPLKGVDKEKLDNLLLMVKAKMVMSYGGESLISGNCPGGLTLQSLWTGESELRLAMRKMVTLNSLKGLSKDELATIKSAFNPVQVDLKKLTSITNKRAENLAKLILQDLTQQMEVQKATGEQTIYSRVSLLDMLKDAKNEYGCVLNERTQGLDIQGVLDFLDKKTIVFDECTEAFLHPDGTIHMPKRCKSENLSSTTLRTVFLNVSVQGNTGNAGIQKVVNDMGLARLTELGVMKQIVENLRKKISSGDRYKAAIYAVMETAKIGSTSVNCYGGKDRTGALLAGITKTILKAKFSEMWGKLKSIWKDQLASKEGVMAQIAHMNANHFVVKIQARFSKLFNLWARCTHWLGAAKLAWQQRKGIQSVSDEPGQLFNRNITQIRPTTGAIVSARGISTTKPQDDEPSSSSRRSSVGSDDEAN